MSKRCTKCREEKLLRHFTKRTKRKKDGSIGYASWCKPCLAKSQEGRNYVKKPKGVYVKKIAEVRYCEVCKNPYYSTTARKKTCNDECSKILKYNNHRAKPYSPEPVASRGEAKEKIKISEKFKVRGKIHYEGHR